MLSSLMKASFPQARHLTVRECQKFWNVHLILSLQETRPTVYYYCYYSAPSECTEDKEDGWGRGGRSEARGSSGGRKMKKKKKEKKKVYTLFYNALILLPLFLRIIIMVLMMDESCYKCRNSLEKCHFGPTVARRYYHVSLYSETQYHNVSVCYISW